MAFKNQMSVTLEILKKILKEALNKVIKKHFWGRNRRKNGVRKTTVKKETTNFQNVFFN